MTYKRTDRNQTEIVKTFRAFGATVTVLSAVGKGVPDLLVGYRGRNYLFELKDGTKPPSARKLTADEDKFHCEWRGHVEIITSIDDVLIFFAKVNKHE